MSAPPKGRWWDKAQARDVIAFAVVGAGVAGFLLGKITGTDFTIILTTVIAFYFATRNRA